MVRGRRIQPGLALPQVHGEPAQRVLQGLVDLSLLLLQIQEVADLLQRTHTWKGRVSETRPKLECVFYCSPNAVDFALE
jgi:hypothetical protein